MERDNTVSLSEVAQALNTSMDIDVLAFDSMRPSEIKEFAPIRIDAMAIILCTGGYGRIGIDLEDYEVKRNTLVVIQPQNYLRFVESSPDMQSCCVLCSINVVEMILPKLTDILPVLMQHRMMPAIELTDKEAEGILSFYKFIKLKLEEPPTRFRLQKVLCMLQAALFEMMDIRLAREQQAGHSPNRRSEIMAKFLLSVSENFRKERQVAYYAKQLCITPKHLSTVVKETSGRTAGEWIDHYVMLEAKMLLRTTDLTIQEITTRLNFTNQSFFGKYFKHHAGESPSSFRLPAQSKKSNEQHELAPTD